MNPAPDAIARAAAALRRGEVVCIPTETTYGLAVDVRAAGALDRLHDLKGDRGEPVAFIAADIEQAKSLARVWPERADELAADFWPAPLTLVIPARVDLPKRVIGPTGGVGVRVSPHAWPRALAAAIGAPITATSANPTGKPPAVSPDEARRYFGDSIEVYLDAGLCSAQRASTVVEVTEDGRAVLLRHGMCTVPGV